MQVMVEDGRSGGGYSGSRCSDEGRKTGNDRSREEVSRHCHLGCHRSLAFQLGLVLFKRLLSTAFQVLAAMMLRHTVLEDQMGPNQQF